MIKFSFSSKVKIIPWIGKRYGNGIFTKRILIVGESHYNNGQRIIGKNLLSLTNDIIIESQIDQDWKGRFYTNIVASIIGHIPTSDERIEFWNSIAFYNFIQNASIAKPGIAPSSEMLIESLVPFEEVIYRIMPELIIIYSYRICDSFLNNLPTEILKPTKGKNGFFAYYQLEEKSIPIIRVQHASRGFSSLGWYPKLAKVLKKKRTP